MGRDSRERWFAMLDDKGRRWKVAPVGRGFVLQVMAPDDSPFYGVWDDYCYRTTESEAWSCVGMLDDC